MPQAADAETTAIETIVTALRPLNELARYRVIEYVTKRLTVELQDTARAQHAAQQGQP
jgi:hypothetical protein